MVAVVVMHVVESQNHLSHQTITTGIGYQESGIGAGPGIRPDFLDQP
jgi:hypothetical protein